MVLSYLRLLKVSVLLSIFLAVGLLVFDNKETLSIASEIFYFKILLSILVALVLFAAFRWLFVYSKEPIERFSSDQAKFLDQFPSPYTDLPIAGSPAISLFLVLHFIRWQCDLFLFFA